MICPNCGATIEEGLLLCEVCGAELQLIPDFDPAIENEISDGLSDLEIGPADRESIYTANDGYYTDGTEYPADGAYPGSEGYMDDGSYFDDGYYDDGSLIEDYAGEDYGNYEEGWEGDPAEVYDDDMQLYDPEAPVSDRSGYQEEELDDFDEEYDGEFDEFDMDEEDVLHQLFLAFRASRFRWVILGVILLIIGILVYGGIRLSKVFYRDHSQAYQVQLAKEAAAAGDYDGAISYMTRALEIDSTDTSLKFTLADYYFENNDPDDAILMLWEIIGSKDINAQVAYRRIVEYYAEKNDFEKIDEILAKCEDSAIVAQFQEYTSLPPEFSEQPGIYGDVIVLKLSASASGKIYYTLDGTIPTQDSELYTTALTFDEMGIYHVKAIFVNSFGIQSSVAEANYTIDILMPDAPVVTPNGGEFTEPELISVQASKHCRIYYTTDGRAPDNECSEYLSPVPMPLGHSHMIFVAYSQDGIPGEFTECDFDLTLSGEVEAQDFINALKQYNVNSGKTVDMDGRLPGSSSHYSYLVGAAIKFEDKVYYLITENVSDLYENTIKTGSYFLGDIMDGTLYRAQRDEADQSFSLGEQIPPEALVPPDSVLDEEEHGEEGWD